MTEHKDENESGYDSWLLREGRAVLYDKIAYAKLHLERYADGSANVDSALFAHFTIFSCTEAILDIAAELVHSPETALLIRRVALFNLIVLTAGSPRLESLVEPEVIEPILTGEDENNLSRFDLVVLIEQILRQDTLRLLGLENLAIDQILQDLLNKFGLEKRDLSTQTAMLQAISDLRDEELRRQRAYRILNEEE